MSLLTDLLFEARAEYIADKQKEKIEAALQKDTGRKPQGVNDALSVAKHFEAAVPPKALQWTIGQYIKGNLKLEDAGKISKDLELFYRHQAKLPKKDLNQYKKPGELYDALENVEGVQSKREAKRITKHEGADYLIKTPNFKALILKTHDAACHYGSNTKWCTAAKDDPSMFDHYTEQGPIYVLIATPPDGGKPRKFQLHYESDQFMNERDEELSEEEIEFLSQFPEYKEFLEILIDKHYVPHLPKDAIKEHYLAMGFKRFLIEHSSTF